jgi:DNA-binding CsgD family transcriptional regulator
MAIWGVAVAARGAATGALNQVVLHESAPPVRFGVSATFVAAIGGIVLLFIPDVVHHGLFEFLLLPVLLAGFAGGLAAALMALGLGGLASLVVLSDAGTSPFTDAPLLAQGLLFAGEGVATAVLTASMRAALRQPVVGLLLSPSPKDRRPALAEPLTPRETEVLELAASGLSVDELAARLFVSPNTVKSHLAHAYDKLGAHNRAQAVAASLRTGALDKAVVEAASEISAPIDDQARPREPGRPAGRVPPRPDEPARTSR